MNAMRYFRRSLPMLVLTVVLLQYSFPQRTVRMNIERIVSEAGIIIRGTVTNVESFVDPKTRLLSTSVTFAVEENLYGSPGSTLTVKMIGGTTSKQSRRLPEMPVFHPGEEVIAMFYRPSALGLTSPVGMGQGKFRIVRDRTRGTMIAKNSFNNAQLFSDMKYRSALVKTTAAASAGSTINAADFTSTLRSLITILKK